MERQDIGCRMFRKLGQGGGKVQRSRKASGLLNEGIGLHERAGTTGSLPFPWTSRIFLILGVALPGLSLRYAVRTSQAAD